MTKGPILVLNAGSSSIKFALFDDALVRRLDGAAKELGGDSALEIAGQTQRLDLADHAAALGAILTAMDHKGAPLTGIAAAGHRVVHGGETLNTPVQICAQTLEAIRACTPLAPLHNPHSVAAIEALQACAPTVPQFASFDTGFHATNPTIATTYALPAADRDAGIRRYGFHGLSYCGLVRRLPEILGASVPTRVLALHLGNGASIAAIRDGRSVATSMGYSPVSGLTMGTRVGEIDANAVLQMVDRHGREGAADVLNAKSGLAGLSGGMSDMRRLLNDPSPEATFAVDHFVHWAIRQAGSLIAAMGGVDCVVFTGGIGEHAAPVRGAIMEGLAWLGLEHDPDANAQNATRLSMPTSRIEAWIVAADEERVIAQDAQTLLAAL